MNTIAATHTASPSTLTPTWRVTYRGEEVLCQADDVPAECQALIARHGAPTATDFPRPEPVATPLIRVVQPTDAAIPPVTPAVRGVTVNETGRDRSAADDAAARAGGFTPAQPLYSRGTMVVQIGVENARAARAKFDAMPTVEQCTAGFLSDFGREQRADVEVGNEVRMDKLGRLVLGSGERLTVNERAFAPLCSRLGFGGGDYLASCWPELRAINLNRWMDSYQKAHAERVAFVAPGDDKPQARTMVLRTRNAGGAREAYAAVSKGYAAFDADKIAQALALAMPENARLRVEYDGFRSRFDVLFHSTVQPEDFVAGEFFRAGITIRTDDTGGGSLRGQTFVEQNLCLNLIIIDKATQPLFVLRHLGSVEKLAEQFRDGLGAAQDTLAHFLAAWGFARKDSLVEAARERGEMVGIGSEGLVRVEDFFAGFATGLIERELVPLRARGGSTVRDLKRMFVEDTSSDGPASGLVTRAGVVNALTRYAHRVEADPFKAAELERSASALLWPSRGRLPEIPFTAPVAL